MSVFVVEYDITEILGRSAVVDCDWEDRSVCGAPQQGRTQDFLKGGGRIFSMYSGQ